MESMLIMSAKERDRLTILTQVCEAHLSVADAAELLSISQRQTYRILKRFRVEGAKGLLHRLRGHPSNRGYGEDVRQRVVKLYWQDYRDYGPTLFSEKLIEHHRLQINHETVRRWLMANGGSNVQRKRRERRTALWVNWCNLMVQNTIGLKVVDHRVQCFMRLMMLPVERFFGLLLRKIPPMP